MCVLTNNWHLEGLNEPKTIHAFIHLRWKWRQLPQHCLRSRNTTRYRKKRSEALAGILFPVKSCSIPCKFIWLKVSVIILNSCVCVCAFEITINKEREYMWRVFVPNVPNVYFNSIRLNVFVAAFYEGLLCIHHDPSNTQTTNWLAHFVFSTLCSYSALYDWWNVSGSMRVLAWICTGCSHMEHQRRQNAI